jgi:hypothetical protein
VSQTTMGTDLLEALEIFTELAVDAVGEDLGVLAVDNVALSVEEPGGDFICLGQHHVRVPGGRNAYTGEGSGGW